MTRLTLFTLAGLALLLPACSADEAAQKPTEETSGDAAPALERRAFNKTAAALHIPLFWTADDQNPGVIDPGELVVLTGYDATWATYLNADGSFTAATSAAIDNIAKVQQDGFPWGHLTDQERARRQALLQELNQGRPTLVLNDFSSASAEDKAIVTHVLNAARLIEALHAQQIGIAQVEDALAEDDRISRAVLHRNQASWCVAPKTENDPQCHVTQEAPARRFGLYPKDLQADKGFCQMLDAHPRHQELLNPFVVVRADDNGELSPVPYTEAYKAKMDAIAKELDAAAAAIEDPAEDAFKAYLLADAEAFRTNQWEPADEAWSKMNVHNSKWYLRLAPDEVYFEPCSRKAGFHVSFARINKDSLEWQNKLEPVKADMEQALAELAGPPYAARDVSFHLPDFIDIVLNAGDSRAPHGATIGQSLPNWGPVANEGRGRTVAMTNLYTDKDSLEARKVQGESLFCPDTIGRLDHDPALGTMSTVLHEAAHNLGPAHEYKVDGKTAGEIFGGPLASTFEELKAQTAALYFAEWLKDRGIIDDKTAQGAHLRDLTWMFGHISRGMYDGNGKPKAYSQLAAIQFGWLVKAGAVQFQKDTTAANGTDVGCFSVDVTKLPGAIFGLAKEVLRIKGSGNKAGAEALKQEFVDDEGTYTSLRAIITERMLRTEKATFVYAVQL